MFKAIVVAFSLIVSTSSFAAESTYELKDCGFTNQELQGALEKLLVPAFAAEGVAVAPNSLAVTDSSVLPRSIYTIDFGVTKRVTFKVVSGEELSLENLSSLGHINPESTFPAIFIEQGELKVYSDLGVLESDRCVASFPIGGYAMMFKNAVTQKALPSIASKVKARIGALSGRNLFFFAKDI